MKANIGGKTYDFDKVYKTKDYEIFELHNLNREVHHNTKHYRDIKEQLKNFGWTAAYPVHCVVNGSGKLKIKAGHHRFDAARELGMEITFMICNDDNVPIWLYEKSYKKWSLQDHLISHERDHKSDYVALRKYQERTGIGLSNCIQLLSGIRFNPKGGSTLSVSDTFKSGEFSIGNPTHANIVGDMVVYCRDVCHIPFANHKNFVAALSKVLSLNEVNPTTLKQKIKTNKSMMEKRPNVEQYIKLIETVYNRNNKARLPIEFMCDQLSNKRSYINIDV